MKQWHIYACFSVIGIFLSGCWVQEAPQEKKKSLFIVADYLTKDDSTVINQFSFDHHVAVTIKIMTPEAIVQRIKSERYNAEIDIILTQNHELRNELYSLGSLKPISNPALFSQLDRQFNNKHHFWLPVSHDPLILANPKDSSGVCRITDFSTWHKSDSAFPALKIKKNSGDYSMLLKNSHHLSWINNTKANRKMAVNESVYSLSEFVALENSRDSTYNKRANGCRSYLVDNKRYITLVNTVSIYTYGRNQATAQKFIRVFAANAYTIASGRNQLPASKAVQPSWYIRSLAIQ